MNIENIHKIFQSNLWKKVLKNKYYRGHYIIDTKRKPNNHRKDGFFFVLLVFFENNTKDTTLENYLTEGRNMVNREGLDNPEIHSFYGTMKMIRYS